MPIQVKTLFEPLTPASRERPDESTWPACEALEQLEREIVRYCRGEVQGCSFLIGGHRGSGKTTLTHIAIEHVQRSWRQGSVDCLPLLVPLHGPNFLSDEWGTERQVHVALSEVVKSTMRAVAEKVSECAIHHAQGSIEDIEVAAQLRVDLDHTLDLASLRDYWDRLGVLEYGLLANYRGRRRDPAQGCNELVAIHTCIDACRVLAEPPAPSSAKASEIPVIVDNKGVLPASWQYLEPLLRATNPFVSIGAGIAVAWSLRQYIHPTVLLVLLGIGTTIVSSWFLSQIGLDRRERTLFAEVTRASLDRLLPVLVNRLLEAGLAPIFVVDELDKVNSLDSKLHNLMKHLKHFVSDRSFFCFLADRAYFESVAINIENNAYPVQSTYFSSRLLIQYTPDDLHAYFNRILLPDLEPSPAMPAQDQDRELVTYIILQLSRLHLGEAHRILNEHTDRKGKVRLPAEGPQTIRAYQYMVLIQCAVEEVLSTREVTRRLRQNPQLRLAAYDALYYPSRQWRFARQQENVPLDCSRDVFSKYLRERSGGSLAITAEDEASFYDAMRRVVHWMATPRELADRLEVLRSSRPRPGLRTMLRGLHPLVVVPGKDAIAAAWQFDDSGKPIAEEARKYADRDKPAQPPRTVADLVARVTELAEFLKGISNGSITVDSLADLVPLSAKPDWDALPQLSTQEGSEDESAVDARNSKIRAFDEDLVKNAAQVRRALLFCLARYVRKEDPATLLEACRAFLASPDVSPSQPEERVSKIEAALRDETARQLSDDKAGQLGKALLVHPGMQFDIWLDAFSKVAGF